MDRAAKKFEAQATDTLTVQCQPNKVLVDTRVSAADVASARLLLGFKKKVKPLSKELVKRSGIVSGNLPTGLCGKGKV